MMKLLTETDLGKVHGGTRSPPIPWFGGSTSADGVATEPVCYPEPNMSTPDGPVYVP